MKTLLVLAVLAIGGWMAYSYFTTGRIALPRFGQQSDDEGVGPLQARLVKAEAAYRGANRAAGLAVDTHSEAGAAMREVSAVLDELRALKPRLKTEPAQRKAAEVEQRAQQLLSTR